MSPGRLIAELEFKPGFLILTGAFSSVKNCSQKAEERHRKTLGVRWHRNKNFSGLYPPLVASLITVLKDICVFKAGSCDGNFILGLVFLVILVLDGSLKHNGLCPYFYCLTVNCHVLKIIK